MRSILTLSLSKGEGLDWQPDRRLQSAHTAIAQHQITAMGAGDVAGDGQPETRAAALQVPALIQTMKRPESLFAPGFGDAGAVVFHGDLDHALVALQADRHLAAMLQGIVQEIADHAPEAGALDADGDM